MDSRNNCGASSIRGGNVGNTRVAVLEQSLIAGTVIETEIELETKSTEDGIARYNKACRNAIERGDGAKLKPEEAMIISWWEEYLKEVRLEQAACRKGAAGKGRAYYGNIINMVKAEKIALLAMHEIVSRCLIDPFGASFRSVGYYVGSAIVAELHASVMKERKCTPKELDRLLASGIGGPRTTHEINRAAKNTLADHVWSMKVCTYLGIALMWKLVGVANARRNREEFKLAFIIKKKFQDGRGTNVIAISPDLRDTLDRGHFLREIMRPRFLPMVAIPIPWAYSATGEIEEGGHYRLRTPFVVQPSTTLREKLLTANLAIPFEVINTISRTPWIINRKMMSVIRGVVERGGGCAGLPNSEPRPIPQRPIDGVRGSPEMKAWSKEARQAHESNEEDASARGGLLLALNVAKKMSGYSPVFFPAQFDFRGRAYPVPIHLNHIGDDSRRGMLLFAEAKKPKDDRQLQIQTANCWGNGINKWDFTSRVNWVKAAERELIAYAEDPVSNDGWMKAEEPFQFLQCCMGLIDPAIGWRIPVHKDGSANGIQHLAAIGRDAVGGASVNLIPSDSPGDVYSDVARSTIVILLEMADGGHAMATRCLSLITRKVVKQPVMTSVYGVTRNGVQNQLLPRLIEIGVVKSEALHLSQFLAPIVIAGIGNQCNGAAGVMLWLQNAVNVILKADRRRTISWTSPMGFPVIHPYWRQSSIDIACHRSIVSLRLHNEKDMQDIRGNKNGIVANVVHSIDASHMGFTAIACKKAGIDFASVHDSFWTHSATVDELSAILRTEFVNMHSKDPLPSIRADWIERYKVDLPELPTKGDLDLNVILKSDYFFS